MKAYDIYRSGNILIVDYADEEGNRKTEEYVLGYDHYLGMADDIFSYMRSENIENGLFAAAVLLDKEYCEYYWDDKSIGYHSKAVQLFCGEEEAVITKKVKPFLAKKKNVNKKLKVIDFDIKGRQMKLYLGKPETKDYWGDDWNDAPYEHNAGSVYSEYVEDIVVVNFPSDQDLAEACRGMCNSPWCKEDFIKKKAPFAYIANSDKSERTDDEYMPRYYRTNFIENPNITKFWFETPVKEFYDAGYFITGV